jgi:hypothetical protein
MARARRGHAVDKKVVLASAHVTLSRPCPTVTAAATCAQPTGTSACPGLSLRLPGRGGLPVTPSHAGCRTEAEAGASVMIMRISSSCHRQALP